MVAIATPRASAARRQRLHGDRRTIGQPTGELMTKCDGELHLHEVEVSGTDACAGHSNQHPVATRTRNMSGDRGAISDAYRSHVETLTAPTALKTDGCQDPRRVLRMAGAGSPSSARHPWVTLVLGGTSPVGGRQPKETACGALPGGRTGCDERWLGSMP